MYYQPEPPCCFPGEFKVAPKAQKLWYQYTMVPRTNIGAQKFGMLASAFPVKASLQ